MKEGDAEHIESREGKPPRKRDTYLHLKDVVVHGGKMRLLSPDLEPQLNKLCLRPRAHCVTENGDYIIYRCNP